MRWVRLRRHQLTPGVELELSGGISSEKRIDRDYRSVRQENGNELPLLGSWKRRITPVCFT